MLNELIGAQLKHIDNNSIIFLKNGEEYRFDIVEEHGDCCGFAEVNTRLFISKKEIERNPVITKIKTNSHEKRKSETVYIVLFGEYKPMAEIIAEAGSETGCCYGACVMLHCKKTKKKQMIAIW